MRIPTAIQFPGLADVAAGLARSRTGRTLPALASVVRETASGEPSWAPLATWPWAAVNIGSKAKSNAQGPLGLPKRPRVGLCNVVM